MVSSEKTSTSKKKRKSYFDAQKQSRADEYKQQIEHNLKATLKNEKRKKAGLARKLASMTLEAVDAEIDAATSEPVPSANLVTAFEDQHWFEHEEQVEKEYSELKHRLHHFGSHLTTGGSGGDLYFGAYDEEQVKQRLEEEENDAPHKNISRGRKKKTHQYYKEKYDISARRLKSEKEELEHTKAAILDCEREIRAGREELKYKNVALKNNEYKVQTLIWILNEIEKHWTDDEEDSSISIPLSRSLRSLSSQQQQSVQLNENGKLILNSSTKLSTLIDRKLMDISNELPLWSDAFKGEGSTKFSSSMSSEEEHDLMRKMQVMLRNWSDSSMD